jgi:hypothetical protein
VPELGLRILPTARLPIGLIGSWLSPLFAGFKIFDDMRMATHKVPDPKGGDWPPYEINIVKIFVVGCDDF